MTNSPKIQPGSDEWLKVISPSKVPSILGISRWSSEYSLWHAMKGLTQPDPPKAIFAVGHAMELAMAEMWKQDNPDWRLSPSEVQVQNSSWGFPAICTIDRRASKGRGRKVVEFKIARDLNDWGDDFSGDCPQDYAAQVLAQMMFTGYHHTADLLVLSGWYKHFTYRLDYDDVVAQFIAQRCQAFYQSLQADTPPELDNSVATYQTVRKLHPDINVGEVVEVPEDLILSIKETQAEANKFDTELRGMKTRLLDLMGNCQTATVNGERAATRSPSSRGSVALRVR